MNTISIQGDELGNTKTVYNSAGQGSGYAPVGTSLTMSNVILDNIREVTSITGREVIQPVNTIPLSPLMYVDDLSKACVNDIDSKDMGMATTAALNQLKMEAHPGLLVFGKPEARAELKARIDKNQTIVQGWGTNP